MMIAPPILAAMLTPALLYGGAAAVGAPILIHLLARRRFRKIRWAAMDFLLQAERRNRRRVRLEEYILLAMRCLSIFLLGVALARPFLSPSGVAAALGGSNRTERVFLLDDSFSMGHDDGSATSFDRAKRGIRKIIEQARSESPDDTVTIFKTSSPDKPVESGTFLSDAQTEEVLTRLAALSPSEEALDITRVVDGVADFLDKSPDITTAAVYVLSDFQLVDWANRREGSGGEDAAATGDDRASLFAPLEGWTSGERGLSIALIDCGIDSRANVAISELGFESGQLVAGTTAGVRAVVTNHSADEREGVDLAFSVANVPQEGRRIDSIGARESVTTSAEVELLSAGYEAVRANIGEDALPIDNTRYLVGEVSTAVRALVVNGEPSGDAFDDEVTFLVTALRPEGDVFSGFEVRVVDETQLEQEPLEDFHLVVLANVYRVSEPAADDLERFVRRGGGLLVYVGDQVEPTLYNSVLYKDGVGLSPVKLGERTAPRDPVNLVIVDRLHPALRGLAQENDPLGLGQIPFTAFFSATAHGANAGDDDLLSGSGASPAAAFPAAVMARFSDADETPAIVERRFGLGRTIFVNTTVDKEWTFWPDHPTFLPVAMELATRVARGGDSGADVFAGQPLSIRLDPVRFEPDVLVRTPAYPDEQEAGITAEATDDASALIATWDLAERAGIYQFVLKKRDGGRFIRLAAVNVSPRESDLSGAAEPDLRQSIDPVPFDYVPSVDALGGALEEAKTEFWRAALVLAAIFLLTEQSLAFFWGRRS